MRYLFVLILSLMVTSSSFPQEQNPYIRQGSVGKNNTVDTQSERKAFEYVPVEKWVGERFIFLPQPKSLQHYGYQDFDVSYDKYVGRIAKVLSISDNSSFPEITIKMEDNGKELSATMYGGSIHSLGPVADIDSARIKWLNKTLWFKKKQLVIFDDDKDKFSHVDIKPYSPINVVDIIAGWYSDSPIRFIIKDQVGNEGFVDLNLSGTNVSEALNKYNHFDDEFFVEDPRKTYNWPSKVWKSIEEEKVFVGMTKEQAEMSWGKPNDINTTISQGVRQEQWVYPNGCYLYFEGNNLTSIQN